MIAMKKFVKDMQTFFDELNNVDDENIHKSNFKISATVDEIKVVLPGSSVKMIISTAGPWIQEENNNERE